MNQNCQNCGKHMPSYVKYCYECGNKTTSQSYVYQYTDGVEKTRAGRVIDYLSMTLMAGFGFVLFLTVGFVLLYYTLFYLSYLT